MTLCMAMRVPDELPAPERRSHALVELVDETFRALVLSRRFSCVAAKSAIRQQNYRLGVYGPMECAGSATALARDLERFVAEQDSFKQGFRTFVASFDDATPRNEVEFEEALWQVLQRLHEIDHPRHAWDRTVSSDPSDPTFSYSFGGSAFFIVGLHPTSTRFARRFAWPTLVFNLHEQFEELRRDGKYERMQGVIRARDVELQGFVHPNLADFGERSEARQYSGRVTDDEWKCPFAPHPKKADE
jgi:uncharacterized protein